jgi:GLPGLI family protein
MKSFITVLLICLSFQGMAQRVVNAAIVKMKTEMEFPENMSAAPGDDGNRMMMMARDMEISSTVFYKGAQTKIETTTEGFGTNYTFIDRNTKRTTTLMEVMGKKQGFYATDEDTENMQKRMDSLRAQRRDSLEKMGLKFASSEPEITYTEEKKKIAGLECKKAIIKTRNQQGELNETAIWYCPDFVMGEGYGVTGQGAGGMRMMGFNPAGLNKIKGFPMEYEIVRQNGMKIHMTVTKVELDANIDDKTFVIPKGYDIKPMSEVQGPGGRMMFRVGG